MRWTFRAPVRCGVVLAGGEGKRLQPFVHRLRAKALPKQFVNILGECSMLENTFHRAEQLIAPERLFTVVNLHHLSYHEVWRQLSCRPKGTVVMQPENKETAAGLLLGLMRVYKDYPRAMAAVFPSDHFVAEEELFMGHVEAAFRAVERNPGNLVILGVDPDGPETEYGYILPAPPGDRKIPSGMHHVGSFVEKPSAEDAKSLLEAGGLWNTFVMVFKVKTLFNLIRETDPGFYRSFRRFWKVMGASGELEELKRIYQEMEPLNFSKGVLEVIAQRDPSRLWVLPVRGVCWSDWGSEKRIVNSLKRIDRALNLAG